MKTNSHKPKRPVESKTPRTAKRKGDYVQRLVQHIGWAVEIRRKDGSTFFAASGRGVSTPVWNHGNRSYACAFVRELKEQDLDAKVVRVAYAEPKVLNDPSSATADAGRKLKP